jgi:16S rRNA (guanine966-N2)-methyltransferase
MALFQIIGPVEGFNILELFAGSGRVSREALANRAASVCLVEKSRTEASKLRQTLQEQENATVYNMDIRRAIRLLKGKGARYDLVFADPPYEKGWIEWLIRSQVHEVVELLENQRLLVLEHSVRETPGEGGTDLLVLEQTRRYGDTCLSFFRKDVRKEGKQ